MSENKKLDKFSMLMEKIQRAYDFTYSIREYDRGIYREHFKPVNRINKENKKDKETIVFEIYDELFPWITDGLAKIQEKYGMTSGDCSPGLDMRFREAFQDLCECTYDQMVEHGIFDSNNNNERVQK